MTTMMAGATPTMPMVSFMPIMRMPILVPLAYLVLEEVP
jgi:hypothetical protein